MKKHIYYFWIAIILVIAGLLRFYQLGNLPPSLYWEEVALGYDAYAIAQTGQDHHGNNWPIVAFESFGDWKPPLYFYSIVPFIITIGLNAWSVRLPAAIGGMFIVLGVGFLAGFTYQTFWEKKEKKYQQLVELVAMALTAISPWAVLFSRAGWEVNLATALLLWGVNALFKMTRVKSANQQRILAATGVVLLVSTMYTYHATRIIAPLIGLGFVVWWLQGQKKKWTFIKTNFSTFILMGLTAVLLSSPLIFSLGSQSTNQRFTETSIFSDISIIETSNMLKEQANHSWWARLLYHRYILFSKEIATNFVSHLQLDFLFVTGDNNPRHSVQYMGQLYHIEIIFLIVGLFALMRRKKNVGLFLLFWLVVVIIPASITKSSPHALRTLPALPVFMVILAAGLVSVWQFLTGWFKKIKYPVLNKIFLSLLVLAYIGEFLLFWRFYTKVYPVIYADQWQYGYQQMVTAFTEAQQQYPDYSHYITREQGRPAMYYWFFSQTKPQQVQAAEGEAKKDQSEFLTFENISFPNQVNEIQVTPALVASSEKNYTFFEEKGSQTEIIGEVLNMEGQTIWLIYLVE